MLKENYCYIPRDNIFMKSNWCVLKQYINSKDNGYIISRSTYHTEVNGHLTITSFDFYCKQLCQVFILERLGGGNYKILKKVPDKLTTTLLFKLLKDCSWKNWFIPIEERLDLID